MSGPAEWVAEASSHFVGNDLSGVVFVRDYIQLQFNPPPTVNSLSTLTVVSNDGSSTVQGAEPFANALIAQVTKVVATVSLYPSRYLAFRFEDGSEIRISVAPQDYVGPEAVNLILPGNGFVAI